MSFRVSVFGLLGVTAAVIALRLPAAPPVHFSGGHTAYPSAPSPVVRPFGTGASGGFRHPIVAPLLQSPSLNYSRVHSGQWNDARNGGGRLPSRYPGRRGYRSEYYPVFLYGGLPFYGDAPYQDPNAYYDGGYSYDQTQGLPSDYTGGAMLYDGPQDPPYVQTPLSPYAAPMPQPQPMIPYAPESGPTAGSSAVPSNAPVVIEPPITIVLRTGQKLVVDNYAVTGGMLWDFSKSPLRKIPVSSIDLTASAQATEATGTDFPDLTGGNRLFN